MPTVRRRLATLLSGLLLGLSACGPSSPSTTPVGPVTVVPSAAATQAGEPSQGTTSPADQPSLTPVPGGSMTGPSGAGSGTTLTDWGRILDTVPDGFPVYPGARPADGLAEPVSGAWVADAATATVADWYVGTFKELGWSSVDLGSALEDGSLVLDLASDLPECRVQATFRPAGGSTMILVLYGAGCAGGDA
jgi:hypothetical protein